MLCQFASPERALECRLLVSQIFQHWLVEASDVIEDSSDFGGRMIEVVFVICQQCCNSQAKDVVW
jgi:hypothetical protein